MSFLDLVNKLRFKRVIELNDTLSIAKCKGKGYALLKNKKILMQDIFRVSNIDKKMYIQSSFGGYYIIDTETNLLNSVMVVSGNTFRTSKRKIKNINEYSIMYFGKTIPEGLLLNDKKTGFLHILYDTAESHYVSEPYKEVSEPNEIGVRKVCPVNINGKVNDNDIYYYIDENGYGSEFAIISESKKDETGSRYAQVFDTNSKSVKECLIDSNDQIYEIENITEKSDKEEIPSGTKPEDVKVVGALDKLGINVINSEDEPGK